MSNDFTKHFEHSHPLTTQFRKNLEESDNQTGICNVMNVTLTQHLFVKLSRSEQLKFFKTPIV